MTDAQRRVVAFVHSHPRLLAALYDLDLMPEVTLVGAPWWSRTVRVVALYAEAAGLEPPWLVAEANATRRRASPAGAVRVADDEASTHTYVPLSQMTPALDAQTEAFVRATTREMA